MKAFFFNFISIMLFSSAALTAVQLSYVIIPEKEILWELVPAPETQLRSGVSILVWNVQKGEAGNSWAEDLGKLAQGKHLVLLQEGMNDSFMPGALRTIPQLGWLMAQNFFMNGDQDPTGVITGHVQTPFSTLVLRTKDTEPITSTPKLSLFTTYVMEKGTRILVVNVHAINFTSVFPFYRQVDEITELIKKWRGKVIMAGDFNTWAPSRTDYLVQKSTEAGMQEVNMSNDNRGLVLDHIFVRGCYAYRAQVHTKISSSDHKPLTADLVCPE